MSTTAHVRPARFDDYEQIARLEAALGSTLSPAEWRRLWQENPLWPRLGTWWPIGWAVEIAGEVTGYLGNIPLQYHLHGERLIAACGRAWFVAPRFRGRNSLRLVETRFDQRGVDIFIDTTIGPMALPFAEKYSSRVPVGDWESIAYRVVGYRAFATGALRKLNVPLAEVFGPLAGAALHVNDEMFHRGASKRHSSFAVEARETFDSDFDTFWLELLRANDTTLLSTRDRETLTWHFQASLRKGSVWILTATRDRRLRAYCILKRLNSANGLTRVRLIDYQTIERDVDLLADMLAYALRRCAAENVSVLEKPGSGLSKFRAFDKFAPYRRKQSWPLFYRAVDPGLAAKLCAPEVWEPSEYDGDATLE